MKLHQEGAIYSQYEQSFPVVLDLDATEDGHLSGFVNFNGNIRPDGFPVGASSESCERADLAMGSGEFEQRRAIYFLK